MKQKPKPSTAAKIALRLAEARESVSALTDQLNDRRALAERMMKERDDAQCEARDSRNNEREANKRVENAELLVNHHRAALLEYFMVLTLPPTPARESRLLQLSAASAGTPLPSSPQYLQPARGDY